MHHLKTSQTGKNKPVIANFYLNVFFQKNAKDSDNLTEKVRFVSVIYHTTASGLKLYLKIIRSYNMYKIQVMTAKIFQNMIKFD